MLAVASVEHLPVEDNSIDLIFTDPPYNKDAIPLYGRLAREAKRVLKPGGFCLVMCGGYKLDKVMRQLSHHLRFFWKLEEFHSGFTNSDPRTWLIPRSKPILAYIKGQGKPPSMVLTAMIDGGNDKRYHHWGQAVECARYYIDVFSRKGDIVLDPFLGGGTTLVACDLIGRRGVGFDLDPLAIKTTQTRLLEKEIPTQALMDLGAI